MSGFPVTCFHFADRDGMIDASLVLGGPENIIPYLCDHIEQYIMVESEHGVRSARLLEAAGIRPAASENREATADEAHLFFSMRDVPDDAYLGEPDGTYVRAWGGVMV